MKVEELQAYEILEKRKIDDLDSMSYVMKHKKSGARIALLSNKDDNKVFYIGFRTPPADSTGVAHILEHSVLCGSKEFPVKDPFIELAKGSLNTFLNAMTYPDKTVYPVASCNDKDFQNLMHVYLDAVFYPNIYQNDKIFKQEGWHYELEDSEDDLKINGVVYNEMKGAFSSPDDVLDREILNSLFPDSTYSVESGGNPDEIPKLTYEHFLEMHRQYYHPSNSYIYLYGDMDMVEKLEYLDQNYLSAFDKIEIDSEIKTQPSFLEPKEIWEKFSITDSEPERENTYLSYNVVVDDGMDKEKYIAYQVLDYVLCGAPEAPLKQTLLDKGIGKDIYSSYENGIKQPYFSVVAKNANKEQKEDFIHTIEAVLRELCKQGLDKKALRAGLNYYEFRYREADFGSYPAGLMYGLQMFDSWLYDEKHPFLHVEANETFRLLKNKIDTNYFESLIEERLLGNPHKSFVIVEPVKGLTAKQDQELFQKLADYKKTLTEEEIAQIIKETKELREFQEEEESPEALNCIPVLQREDIKKTMDKLIIEEKTIDGSLSLYHNVFTNQISYFRLLFDIRHIPDSHLPYVGILKAVLGYVDTKSYSFSDLFNEINIQTGGIASVVNIYTNSKELDKYKFTFEIKAKTLENQLPQTFSLMKEIILFSSMKDEKRLYEIIAEMKSRMQSDMTSAGHQLAAGRATSYFSETAALQEIIGGLPFYRLIERIEVNFENEKVELITKLQELCQYIFRPEKLMFDYTGEKTYYLEFAKLAENLKRELNQESVVEKPYQIELSRKNEGLLSSSQIQYVCMAGNYRKGGLEYNGALRVLKVILGYDYLWNFVRVKGGAYGCMCRLAANGESYFVSYRDPNLRKTIEVFEGAAEYISNFKGDERSMTQYIIGAISAMDTPLTPAAKGLRALSAYLTKQTDEDLQRDRDELLAANEEIIRKLSVYIRNFIEDNCICVVGNEEKIKEEAKLFMVTDNLFH